VVGVALVALFGGGIGSQALRAWESPERLDRVEGRLDKIEDTLREIGGKLSLLLERDDAR